MTSLTTTSDAGRLSWRAIFAGAVVALGIHLLLTMLGGGIAALIARPSSSDTPMKTLAIGGAIAWCLSALISLWVGGCVAGRTGARGDEESGKIHGFVMWSLATVIAFFLVFAGVGGAITGAAKIAGSTVASAGKTVAEAAPDLLGQANQIVDQYTGEINPEGRELSPAAKRELARSLKNLLTADPAARDSHRPAVVNVLVTEGGMPPDQAGKTVDEWIQSYDRSMEELRQLAATAETKAKEIADRAAVATGQAAIWTFAAFWLGALAAAWGGRVGATAALRHARREDVPASRPVTA